MIEEFSHTNQHAIKLIKRITESLHFSHAYIIETRENKDGFLFSLAFAKTLLCPNHYINTSKCDNCYQCKKIDTGNFIELKIIEPDGLWIKKEQLLDLQTEFSRKSIEGNKKIYIINKADRLNSSAANSMLKFLEEPEDGIIAILVVSNIQQLLPTIVSRCQIISMDFANGNLGKSTKDILNEIINYNKVKSDYESLVNTVTSFIKLVEHNGLDAILYENKIFETKLKDREYMVLFLNILLLFYKDVLNIKNNQSAEVFFDHYEFLMDIARLNEIKTLCNKIGIIFEYNEKVLYNININLMLDRLIIDLDGVSND